MVSRLCIVVLSLALLVVAQVNVDNFNQVDLNYILATYSDPACTEPALSQQQWTFRDRSWNDHCFQISQGFGCRFLGAESMSCFARIQCDVDAVSGVRMTVTHQDHCIGTIQYSTFLMNNFRWPILETWLGGACVFNQDEEVYVKLNRRMLSAHFPNCTGIGGVVIPDEGPGSPQSNILRAYTNEACTIRMRGGYDDMSRMDAWRWELQKYGTPQCFDKEDITPRNAELQAALDEEERPYANDMYNFKIICGASSSGMKIQYFAGNDRGCQGDPQQTSAFFWGTCYQHTQDLFAGDCVRVGGPYYGYMKFDHPWDLDIFTPLPVCDDPALLPVCPTFTRSVSGDPRYDINNVYLGPFDSPGVVSESSAAALEPFARIILVFLATSMFVPELSRTTLRGQAN